MRIGFWQASAAALVLAGAPVAARADEADGFTLSAAVRLRYETVADEVRAGFGQTDSLVNLRTRVLAQVRARPFRAVAELFDSRAWGADATTPLTTGEVNALELVQAYAAADLGPVLGRGSAVTVQAGRMMLNLGSRRLVAADDYRNTTQGYTGVLAEARLRGGVRATLIYTLPQERLPDDRAGIRAARVVWDRESLAQVLWGGLVSRTRGAAQPVLVEGSLFHFGEHDAPGRPTRDRSLNTAGLRVLAETRPGRIDYEAEAMLQWGQAAATAAPGAALLPVSATFVHARAGYALRGGWKPRISVEFDRASGDRPGNGTFGRFDTLFGMRRAEFAPAGLYNAVTRANIVSPGFKIEAAPTARLEGSAEYRPMWLADRRDAFGTTGVRDASGRSGNFAGHQIDAAVRWWIVPQQLRMEVAGTVLFKGRFLKDAPNAPPGATTRYLSVNLTASL